MPPFPSSKRVSSTIPTVKWQNQPISIQGRTFITRKSTSKSSSSSGSDSESDSESSSESSSSSTSSSYKKVSPAFTSSKAAKSFDVPSGAASAYSFGGGTRFTLGSDSPFPGRQAGGADRDDIFGTSRIGSGYIYDANGTFIYGRGFPYVFIPIAFANNYYGSGEYENISDRPGGVIATAIIQPVNNTINTVTYHIIGDSSSVEAVFTALVLNCSVANSSDAITPYTLSLSANPQPEQIIQWYRASTFALSLDGYNNTAATYANQPQSDSDNALPLSDDTPLPSTLNDTFLQCINQTIGASAPLIVPPTSSVNHLTTGDIIGIAIGVSFGIAIVYSLLRCCCGLCWCSAKKWARSDSISSNKKKAKKVNFATNPGIVIVDVDSGRESSDLNRKEDKSRLHRSSSSVSSITTLVHQLPPYPGAST